MADASAAPHAEELLVVLDRVPELVHHPLPPPFLGRRAGVVTGPVEGKQRVRATVPRPDAPARAVTHLIRDIEAVARGAQEAARPAPEALLGGGLPKGGVVGLPQPLGAFLGVHRGHLAFDGPDLLLGLADHRRRGLGEQVSGERQERLAAHACDSSRRSSPSATARTSAPAASPGPPPTDVQKQLAIGRLHASATTVVRAQDLGVVRVGRIDLQEDPVERTDRSGVAWPHAEKQDLLVRQARLLRRAIVEAEQRLVLRQEEGFGRAAEVPVLQEHGLAARGPQEDGVARLVLSGA